MLGIMSDISEQYCSRRVPNLVPTYGSICTCAIKLLDFLESRISQFVFDRSRFQKLTPPTTSLSSEAVIDVYWRDKHVAVGTRLSIRSVRTDEYAKSKRMETAVHEKQKACAVEIAPSKLKILPSLVTDHMNIRDCIMVLETAT